MNDGFPEYDGRARFPKKQPKGFCRGCRLPIDPKLEPRAQTWHQACKKKFDPFHVKQAVRKRAGDKCEKCGKDWKREHPKPEYDHIIPHCEGGLFTFENIRLLCISCHRERTAKWRREKSKKSKIKVDAESVFLLSSELCNG